MHELRRATRRLAREWRSILAIDQSEELFTACNDEQERGQFVEALVRAARSGDSVVVLAVRADFYGRCASYPELSDLLGANHNPGVHTRRRLPARPHRHRARPPLGRATLLVGTTRLPRRQPDAHPRRVERRTARPRIRARLLPLKPSPDRPLAGARRGRPRGAVTPGTLNDPGGQRPRTSPRKGRLCSKPQGGAQTECRQALRMDEQQSAPNPPAPTSAPPWRSRSLLTADRRARRSSQAVTRRLWSRVIAFLGCDHARRRGGPVGPAKSRYRRWSPNQEPQCPT